MSDAELKYTQAARRVWAAEKQRDALADSLRQIAENGGFDPRCSWAGDACARAAQAALDALAESRTAGNPQKE